MATSAFPWKLALNQEVEVLPRDVWAGVSDIQKRSPAERRFVLNEMIELMVAHRGRGSRDRGPVSGVEN